MSQSTPPQALASQALTPRHYQAVCGLSLAAMFLVQIQQDIVLIINLLMLVIGAACVLYKTRVSPLFVLLALAIGQIVEQHEQNQFFSADARAFRFLDGMDVLLCTGTLIYLMAQYRLHGLWFHVLPYDSRARSAAQGRSADTMAPDELGWLVMPVPAFALAAEFFTALLKQHWSFVGLPPRWRQFIAIAWIFLLFGFAGVQFFRAWRRRQMDRPTAQLLLQDVLWHETRREQRRIQRWIVWRKLKQQEESHPV